MIEPSSHDQTMARIGKWSLGVTIVGVAIAFIAYYWPRSATPQPDGPVTPPPTSTYDERNHYIQAADAICMRWAREAGKQPAGEVTMEEQEVALTILDSMLVEWSALQPPAADQATVDGIISQYRKGSSLSREAFTALSHGDQSTYESLRQQGITAGEEAMARSREYGFRVC